MRKLSIIHLGTHVFYIFHTHTASCIVKDSSIKKTIFFEKTAETATNYIFNYAGCSVRMENIEHVRA